MGVNVFMIQIKSFSQQLEYLRPLYLIISGKGFDKLLKSWMIQSKEGYRIIFIALPHWFLFF
jgi:hypothetical protein